MTRLCSFIIMAAMLFFYGTGKLTAADATGVLNSFYVSPLMSRTDGNKAQLALSSLENIPADWQLHTGSTENVDLKKLFPGHQVNNVSVFIYIPIVASASTQVFFTFGSDDGLTAFLNGVEIVKTEFKRACVPDSDRHRAVLRKGTNHLLLRIDNVDGGYAFSVRCLSLQEHDALYARMKHEQTVLLRPPYLKRTDKKIKHFIMAQPVKGILHGMYGRFFDGSLMDSPDGLEMRTQIYALDDYRSGTPCNYAADGLGRAHGDAIPEFEFSPVMSGADPGSTKENPTLAQDPFQFFQSVFHATPSLMTDMNGQTPSDARERGFSTKYCLTPYDPLVRDYVMSVAKRSAELAKAHSDWNIKTLHVRSFNFNDWYYPNDDRLYDYSTEAKKAYRDWLLKRYGSLMEINRRYNSSLEKIDDLAMPQPNFDKIDVSPEMRDFQEFRISTVDNILRDIFLTIRKVNPHQEMTGWMTTATVSCARDGIVLDNAMKLAQEFPGTLMTLTCGDFDCRNYPLSSELFGQLAIAYGVNVGVEPIDNNAESYRKTFFNILRFPIKKVNWLFFIPNPVQPHLKWVMAQRPVADELADAVLVQEKAAILFSYSTLLYQIPHKLTDLKYIQTQYNLFHALQNHQIHMPMISDRSLDIPLDRYQSILIVEQQLIAPEMIKKIGDFVRNGGKLVLVGGCGEIDVNTGHRDFPLLRELNVSSSNQDKGHEYRGKGEIIIYASPLKALIHNGNTFNEKGVAMLREMQILPKIKVNNGDPVNSFIKQKSDITYLGFINPVNHAVQASVEYLPLRDVPETFGTELFSGQKVKIINGNLLLNFEIGWQPLVFRLEPQKH